MKKFFIAALIICGLAGAGFGQQKEPQKYRKISQMIADSEKASEMFSGLMGLGSSSSTNSKTTILSAITFPNAVEVKFLGDTRKISKNRKKAADKWLKEYAETPAARQFYANEILVEEDGVRHWIMAHESAVITKLKDRKSDTVILKMRILGFTRKGAKADFYLLAEGLQ